MITSNANHTMTSELPRGCTFTAEDWHVLSQYWYPVAQATEVTDKPLAAQLLDVKLVLYRSNDQVVVAKDLCFHRGLHLVKAG